jgi:hypothetical protein
VLALPENQQPAKQITPKFESAGFKPALFWWAGGRSLAGNSAGCAGLLWQGRNTPA